MKMDKFLPLTVYLFTLIKLSYKLTFQASVRQKVIQGTREGQVEGIEYC